MRVIERMVTAWRSSTHNIPFAIAAVVIGLALGNAVARGGQLGAVFTVGIIGVVIFLVRPVNVGIIALLAVYAVQRLGSASSTPGSGGGISYSDALLSVAAVLALVNLIGTPEIRRLKLALVCLMIYLATLLPTVILHNTGHGPLEFAHRLVLVGGGLIVGAWLAREGAAGTSLRAIVVLTTVVSLVAIENSLTHGLLPASPFGLNKNLVGSQFAVVFVLLLAVPSRIPLSRRLRWACGLVILGGMIAAQSRGALIGALVALFIAIIAGRSLKTRLAKLTVVLMTLIIGGGVYLSVAQQLSSQNANTNALGVRFNVEKRTRQIWRTSPITGVGLKYFVSGKDYGPLAQVPNNAIDNELAESGVVGAAGFVVLQLGVITAGVRRRRDPLALAGAGIVAGFLVHGMVDIYWSAGVAALPFVILGMGLGERETPAPARTADWRTGVGRPASQLVQAGNSNRSARSIT